MLITYYLQFNIGLNDFEFEASQVKMVIYIN